MKRLLLLGIGSPFGADRIGWELVEQLRGSLPEIEGCELVLRNLAHPTQLLSLVEGFDGVIVIDALLDAEPGSLHRLTIDELKESERSSSHQLGVAEALALARAMGDLPEWLEVIGVGVGARPRSGS